MRRSVFPLAAAVLVGVLLHQVTPAQAQQKAGAGQRLLFAANYQGSFDVIEVNRLMRAAKRVNLRSGPGTDYEKIGVLEVGEVVWVTGEVGADWMRMVTRRGRVAFVYAPLLAHLSQPVATADYADAVRGVAAAHHAVWRVHWEGHDEGTAFAVGLRHFITALHVLLGVPGGVDNLASITLMQEGNPVELHLNRVLAINVAHDLAYLETRERVADYLSPVYEGGLPLAAYETTDQLGDGLTLVGYIDESLARQEGSGGIIYEDVFSYALATAYPNLHGMSGSPVVNAEGKVVGVVHYAQHNMAFAMKIRYVAGLLSSENGTVTCTAFLALQACLSEGVRAVKARARQGDVLSLYALGSEHGEIRDIEPDYVLSLDALRKVAEAGFAPAEYELGSHLSSQGRKEEAFAWVERSAMKGNPQAVYGLGRAYLIGYGTEKNERLGNAWLEKSRQQGFMPEE